MNNTESIVRVDVDGKRHYQVTVNDIIIGTFPSMTTVLGNTRDDTGIDEWRNKIGHEEADRITNLSGNRGTIMHRLIELYKLIQGTPCERLSRLIYISGSDKEINQFNENEHEGTWLTAGWEMFLKFWMHHDLFFDRIQTVLASEKFIWSSKGYAGTLDNVSQLYDGKILIIDYKNSRRPKKDEWIQDYFIQVAGYAIAFWERTGIVPTGCEVWIASETEDKPQIFTLTQTDIKYYYREFIKRLNQYTDEK